MLECKQTGLEFDTRSWDKAWLRAYGQAVQYVRALPPTEGRPPLVVVVDVGRSLELYSEFSRSGAYIPFPNPRSHRICLEDLRRPEIRARLQAVWLDPPRLAAAPGSEPAAETAEVILQRLVTLNTERAAEERRGLIRWLRPEFHHPAGTANIQAEAKVTATTPTASGPKPNWPKSLPEQFQALRAVLAVHPGPATASDLAQGFTRAPRAKLAELLENLATLGHAHRLEDGRYLPG